MEILMPKNLQRVLETMPNRLEKLFHLNKDGINGILNKILFYQVF